MARITLCLAVLALVFIVPQVAEAQSPELSVPQMVVRDADGKVMGQVARRYLLLQVLFGWVWRSDLPSVC